MNRIYRHSIVLLYLILQGHMFNCNAQAASAKNKSELISCPDYRNYSLYPYPEHTSIKTISISINVFQRADGGGSFHDSRELTIDMFQRLIDSVNHRLSHLAEHTPASGGPYIADSRIRVFLNQVYFYTRDSLYNYAAQRGRDGRVIDSLYQHVVMANPDLSDEEKNGSLQVIMLPGGNTGIGGRSSSTGRNNWIGLRGYDYSFNWGLTPVRETVGHFIHELGHNLGLRHNFSNDPNGSSQCDACEDNGCPPYGTSNNYMDYTIPTYRRTSFTDCQIAIMHSTLMGNRGNIRDCLIKDYCKYERKKTVVIPSGMEVHWAGSKDLEGDVLINNEAKLTISCSVALPESASVRVKRGGQLTIHDGQFRNGCEANWGGIIVEKGGALVLKNTIVADYSIVLESGSSVEIADHLILANDSEIAFEKGTLLIVHPGAEIEYAHSAESYTIDKIVNVVVGKDCTMRTFIEGLTW